METIIVKAVRRFPFSRSGYAHGSIITITAQAYHLQGNKHPHFSVTCDVKEPRRRHISAGGCMHEDAVKIWPAIRPIIALHLANADDGEPMHAEANGWYWMAGALGGAGERYHGGNSERQHWKNGEFAGFRLSTPDECLEVFAELMRISLDEAQALREKLRPLLKNRPVESIGHPAIGRAAKKALAIWVSEQRSRWQKEAEAGIALLRDLSGECATCKV